MNKTQLNNREWLEIFYRDDYATGMNLVFYYTDTMVRLVKDTAPFQLDIEMFNDDPRQVVFHNDTIGNITIRTPRNNKEIEVPAYVATMVAMAMASSRILNVRGNPEKDPHRDLYQFCLSFLMPDYVRPPVEAVDAIEYCKGKYPITDEQVVVIRELLD